MSLWTECRLNMLKWWIFSRIPKHYRSETLIGGHYTHSLYALFCCFVVASGQKDDPRPIRPSRATTTQPPTLALRLGVFAVSCVWWQNYLWARYCDIVRRARAFIGCVLWLTPLGGCLAHTAWMGWARGDNTATAGPRIPMLNTAAVHPVVWRGCARWTAKHILLGDQRI